MEIAVRSVLLSEIQSVLSIARRRYGYALVPHNGAASHDDSQGGIFHSFALLRARLLRCEVLSELNPSTVLRPFLDLIRHEHSSSTLTGSALEAVQHFLQSWDWQVNQANVPDMLADVVDAVSQCRFQETNAESDQHVLVLVVHLLETVVSCPLATKLSDHAMWQLVEALYALSRANRSDPHITLTLRAAATNVLDRAVELIFQNPAVYSKHNAGVPRPIDAGFGLPCAVKIVGFLCQKLQPRGSGTATAPSSGASGGASSSTLPTRREVLLSFTLMQRVLVSCDAEQLSQIPSLMLFIKDDLCGSILRYGRLGASSDLKIAVLCLGILRLLWTKLRPMLKMQLEALINGIFCHTLHWTVAHLDLANPIFPNNLESTTSSYATIPPSQPQDPTVFTNVDAVREEFTGEIVPLNKLFSTSFEILDCLVDLLAEPTLLPDLYVNYDCDSNRSDLLSTVFDLLSSVAVKTHHACQETSDEVHFLWAHAVGELALRGLFNALYVIYTRSQEKSRDPISPSTSDGERASAEVLHRRRQRKKLFQHGVYEFNRKPLSGIKYLQQHCFLPTPLDPKSMAMFLRSLPPGLNKAAVGMYLGAMGKEVKEFEKLDIHEADTMEFHRKVLEHFVLSFNFESDSIVTALRMFLASFRLPGEAQQIDRILNTFSAQVFEQCRDRFLMASPDVAYLMSFSLIMLNTDLHNPNIRQEKKMKLEDFMKNNRNYGVEVSKNQDLPDEFMVELYETIAKEEIKTREDDSKHGEVTTDRWKDLLYQAESDPKNSRLIVHHPLYKSQHRAGAANGSGSSSPRRHSAHPSPQLNGSLKISQRSKSTSALPGAEGAEGSDARRLFGSHSDTGVQYDKDILMIIQDHLTRAFSGVFQQYVGIGSPDSSTDPRSTSSASHEDVYLPDKGMLQLACNGFVLSAATAAAHDLRDAFNQLFKTVAQFSGLYPSDVYPAAYNGRLNGVSMYCQNQSAPVATAAMLKIVGASGHAMKKESWADFFHAIATLREFGALPDRLLHGVSGDPLLSEDESHELLHLVQLNREELEKREALRLKSTGNNNGRSSSFFSGMAWLMSALDSAPAVPSSPSSAAGIRLLPTARTPPEYASDARDLVIKPARSPPAPSLTHENFGTSEWIQHTLKPYRLDHISEEIAKLPVAAICEVISAVHVELTHAFTTTPETTRRTSSFPGALNGHPVSPVNHAAVAPPTRRPSPASCVLFEHLLARVLASLPRESIQEYVDGIWEPLQVHYMALPNLLRPILLKNASINGIGYDNAALALEKALEGLFTLTLKSRCEKPLQLLGGVLTTIVDMSADEEELPRPYLTLISSGFKRVADVIDLRVVRFDRGEWLTVSSLVGLAVEQPHAAIHAFAFLEKLVASEVWLADVETTFSLMELYTKALMFALHRGNELTWPPKRPMELLAQLYDHLKQSDAEIEEEERLRQLGGMVLVCRHALRPVVAPSSLDHTPNDKLMSSLEHLRGMITSAATRECVTGGAWLEVLSSGLLVIGAEILGTKSRKQDASRPRQGSDDGSYAGPFLFFERNVPPSMALPSLAIPDAADDKKSPTGRRRRPSIVKDPSAIRSHIMVVELISWVTCEYLDQLLLLPRFASVWDRLVDQLLAFIEFTSATPRSAQGAPNEEALAALERRSILSAHEEIVEHVKSVIRRLTVLLYSYEAEKKKSANVASGGEDAHDKSALAGARFHALMHVLVEKCQAKGPAFYDQLFQAQDESASPGKKIADREGDVIVEEAGDEDQAGAVHAEPDTAAESLETEQERDKATTQ